MALLPLPPAFEEGWPAASPGVAAGVPPAEVLAVGGACACGETDDVLLTAAEEPDADVAVDSNGTEAVLLPPPAALAVDVTVDGGETEAVPLPPPTRPPAVGGEAAVMVVVVHFP